MQESQPAEAPRLLPRQAKLLRVIGAYTGPESGTSRGRWLKRDMLYVIIHRGIEQGYFAEAEYDHAPSLVAFHGVKHFAMLSQEALLDIVDLFKGGYVDKMLLSSYYYSTQVALRISRRGRDSLGEPDAGEAARLAELVYCRRCKRKDALLDYRIETGASPKVGIFCRICEPKKAKAGAWTPDPYTAGFFYLKPKACPSAPFYFDGGSDASR